MDNIRAVIDTLFSQINSLEILQGKKWQDGGVVKNMEKGRRLERSVVGRSGGGGWQSRVGRGRGSAMRL